MAGCSVQRLDPEQSSFFPQSDRPHASKNVFIKQNGENEEGLGEGENKKLLIML